MNYKYCCVVDADGSYKTFVLVLLEQSEGSKTTESVQGYTLTAGERLIDTAPPTKREHAGTAGFVKPRWDENDETWVEGATDEELAAWEVEHPDPVPLEDKRAAKHLSLIHISKHRASSHANRSTSRCKPVFWQLMRWCRLAAASVS